MTRNWLSNTDSTFLLLQIGREEDLVCQLKYRQHISTFVDIYDIRADAELKYRQHISTFVDVKDVYHPADSNTDSTFLLLQIIMILAILSNSNTDSTFLLLQMIFKRGQRYYSNTDSTFLLLQILQSAYPYILLKYRQHISTFVDHNPKSQSLPLKYRQHISTFVDIIPKIFNYTQIQIAHFYFCRFYPIGFLKYAMPISPGTWIPIGTQGVSVIFEICK